MEKFTFIDLDDAQRSLERAVLDHGPPGAVIVGADISPDGKYAVALTLFPTANYLMDDLFVWDGQWKSYGGGSGGGTNWTSLAGDSGVLRFASGAPAGTELAVVTYEGRQSRVPVRHGHFLFVAWDTRSRTTRASTHSSDARRHFVNSLSSSRQVPPKEVGGESDRSDERSPRDFALLHAQKHRPRRAEVNTHAPSAGAVWVRDSIPAFLVEVAKQTKAPKLNLHPIRVPADRPTARIAHPRS